MSATDPFFGEDMEYLQQLQDILARSPTPASLDEACACIYNSLNLAQTAKLDSYISDFRLRLDGGYLNGALPVGLKSQLTVVPALATYRKDYALIIHIWSLDDLGDGVTVYGIINSAGSSKSRALHLEDFAPFIKFLIAALEALPKEFHIETGRLLRAQIPPIRSPSGAEILPAERFPNGRRFYRYIFQASCKFNYARFPPDFLDSSKPDDPGMVFEIQVTEKCPAWDIEAFSYFTIDNKSEGEVLFSYLAFWIVSGPVERKEVIIDGETLQPWVVPVRSIGSPSCRYCGDKMHEDYPQLHYKKGRCRGHVQAKSDLKDALDIGDWNEVRKLYAVEPGIKDSKGTPLIVCAVQSCQDELVRLLLEHGQSVEPLRKKLQEGGVKNMQGHARPTGCVAIAAAVLVIVVAVLVGYLLTAFPMANPTTYLFIGGPNTGKTSVIRALSGTGKTSVIRAVSGTSELKGIATTKMGDHFYMETRSTLVDNQEKLLYRVRQVLHGCGIFKVVFVVRSDKLADGTLRNRIRAFLDEPEFRNHHWGIIVNFFHEDLANDKLAEEHHLQHAKNVLNSLSIKQSESITADHVFFLADNLTTIDDNHANALNLFFQRLELIWGNCCSRP